MTDRLNAALQSALKAPDVMERLGRLGLTAAPGSSADMAQRLARDKATWAPAIKASGFKADRYWPGLHDPDHRQGQHEQPRMRRKPRARRQLGLAVLPDPEPAICAACGDAAVA